MTLVHASLRPPDCGSSVTFGLWIGCAAAALAVGPAFVGAQAPPNPANPAVEVDAATKKLMAANGLFQRGLFKLAAGEYGEFLAQYPQHAELTSARYALAVCQ